MEKKQTIHPLTDITLRVVQVFHELGFAYVDGPEMETEYYNFDALNVPKDHPARDMQDTFWLKNAEGRLMRTQTSGMQVHYMEKNKPPLRIIAPGKVYRSEATDATHEAQFQQFEGLVVDKGISLATLKSTLNIFFDRLFERDIEVRFRPSYFPFTEPSAEIDISCFKCARNGEACSVCKGSGWVEVMGAGMVHPTVLTNVGIDTKEYRGFAFGGSIERLAMLKYGVDDIRLFYSGDLRLVNQFKTK